VHLWYANSSHLHFLFILVWLYDHSIFGCIVFAKGARFAPPQYAPNTQRGGAIAQYQPLLVNNDGIIQVNASVLASYQTNKPITVDSKMPAGFDIRLYAILIL
jgi:hypothetical protein